MNKPNKLRIITILTKMSLKKRLIFNTKLKMNLHNKFQKELKIKYYKIMMRNLLPIFLKMAKKDNLHLGKFQNKIDNLLFFKY